MMEKTRFSRPAWLDERPGVYDTGNGAIKKIEANPGFPGIQRVIVRSYSGRWQDDRLYYRLTAQPERRFASLAEAIAARGVRLT